MLGDAYLCFSLILITASDVEGETTSAT